MANTKRFFRCGNPEVELRERFTLVRHVKGVMTRSQFKSVKLAHLKECQPCHATYNRDQGKKGK